MATQDKVILMNKIEGTLRPRMFANLLDEAVEGIQEHLDEFEVTHIKHGDVLETEDLLQAFIKAKQVEGRSEKTLVRYQYVIGRFMAAVGAKTRDVTTHHVRDYLATESARGVSNSTLEGYRQVLNGYFGWLEHEKLIVVNPMYNVAGIKCEKKVRETFADSDIEKMKRSCDSVRNMAIICFLLSTGCRVSEVSALNRDDIDFDNCECVVYGKGKKFRVVYLDDVAVMTLREYLASRNDNEEALFLNRYKGRLPPDSIRKMLKKIGRNSNVKNVHPHRFRRTLITNLLNHGMPIQEVCIVAGHDKTDTTMKYFSSNKNRIKSSYLRYS